MEDQGSLMDSGSDERVARALGQSNLKDDRPSFM